ncbi:PACE efflux transporter [Janthinobacterium sp.]|uniref:PACE efflux transporter n=1 Tax=Janthinobacterium sp. TaxID=1871054 RepID=UPI0028A2DD19|nr:PACE efflux transporter [Janthinobacterium sp.]
MQGIKRKIVYVTAFEIIGMTISTLWLTLLSGESPTSTGPLAIMITSIAVIWNLLYNTAFEYWEIRQVSRTRTVWRRIVHAIGFQITLVVYLIPLIAWWLHISLWDAFVLDFALMLIIPCYSFVFNYVFDGLFGVPLSAQQPKEEAGSIQGASASN